MISRFQLVGIWKQPYDLTIDGLDRWCLTQHQHQRHCPSTRRHMPICFNSFDAANSFSFCFHSPYFSMLPSVLCHVDNNNDNKKQRKKRKGPRLSRNSTIAHKHTPSTGLAMFIFARKIVKIRNVIGGKHEWFDTMLMPFNLAQLKHFSFAWCWLFSRRNWLGIFVIGKPNWNNRFPYKSNMSAIISTSTCVSHPFLTVSWYEIGGIKAFLRHLWQ